METWQVIKGKIRNPLMDKIYSKMKKEERKNFLKENIDYVHDCDKSKLALKMRISRKTLYNWIDEIEKSFIFFLLTCNFSERRNTNEIKLFKIDSC